MGSADGQQRKVLHAWVIKIVEDVSQVFNGIHHIIKPHLTQPPPNHLPDRASAVCKSLSGVIVSMGLGT